jgi:hypothetical protein
VNTIEDFNKFISDVFGEVTETASFLERIGPPEELPAIIGLICMKFSYLEETLTHTIIKMLQLDEDRGQIMTAELSFKIKVNVFYALYQKLKDKYYFNTFPDFEDEYFRALTIALNKCEALRNQVMHSSFTQSYLTNSKIIRKKITAKKNTGLRKIEEVTDIVRLFNIADFITNVDNQLDEFGIDIMNENQPLTKAIKNGR